MTRIARGAASTRALQFFKHKLVKLGVAGLLGIGAIAVTSAAQAAGAGISAVTQLSTGQAFGGCSIGTVGTFTFKRGWAVDLIDPADPHNATIVDIGLAQKDANGMIQVWFNFDIIYPTDLSKGNGKVLTDIPNRGGTKFNLPNRSIGGNAPETATTNCNNTYWWPQGYATVNAGWEADPGTDPTQLANTNFSAVGTLNGAGVTPLLTMPIAVGPGNATITGPGYEYIVVNDESTGIFYLGGGERFPAYPMAPLGNCAGFFAVMTWRHHLDDTPTALPSTYYTPAPDAIGNCAAVAMTTAAIPAGFALACTVSPTCPTGAGFLRDDIYELHYTAANPTVNGLGMAVIRDFHSWLKGNSGTAAQSNNPLGNGYIKQLYSYTESQPARTINDYLKFGFNGDINNKRVIDGMVNWIGAGAGLSMNYRWSHTTGTERNRQQHLWVESFFPFADVSTFDPISNTTAGRYDRCTANNTCPLMNLLQYSSNEYWVKTASLLHTDPTGTFDLPDHPLSRRYLMASVQHGGGTQITKTNAGVCQNWNNPLDQSHTTRALWTAMDQAVTANIPPPPSMVPTLANKTLVLPADLPFPSGWQHTVGPVAFGNPFPVIYTALQTTRYRFDMGPNFYTTGIPTINPPVITGVFENNRNNGPIYKSYVPQVNADGNETSGIQLPELLAPLATYAGFNYRSFDHDGPDGCEGVGSYIGFSATTADAQTAGDPRPPVTARFPTYGAYVNAVVAAVDKLVWQRFYQCGEDTRTVLANKLSSAYAASVPTLPNEQPAIANSDWSFVTGGNQNSPTPPTLLPACNGALTHNFNGATGQLQTGAVQVPLVAGFDGNSDILWRDTSGNVGLWLMNGTLIQSTAVVANVPATWSIVGQRDFNGDGNADILWRDTSGNVGIWLMNGTSIQSTAVLGNVPSSWSVAGIIGFNTGGYNNILWRNSNGDVGLWFMNGTTVVSTSVVGNLSPAWTIAGTDARGNIFWRNTTTGDVQQWVLNGTVISKQASLGNVPLIWTIAGVGDFDGNGSTDILWRDTSGNVGIWLMNGTTVSSTSVVANVPSIWTIQTTGDFNGDGMSDILWRDSSGNLGTWFMNGNTLTSTTVYGNVSNTWQVQALNAD